MIGATNALCEAARTFWRTHIDHKIDRAPINAEIQCRCAHDCTQFACRHGIFDATTLAGIQRAVMQCNREIVVIDAPELLENRFCLLP